MEALLAIAIGVLVTVGVYLVLRPHTFSVVLGYTVLSYGVNLFLFGSGRLGNRAAPIVEAGGGPYMDPLPQALVLTAIVIGLAMMAILLVLSLRAYQELGVDHVDGVAPPPADEEPPP